MALTRIVTNKERNKLMEQTDDRYTIPLTALQWVLTQRLKHSRTWNHVKIVKEERKFTIRWEQPKSNDNSFQERSLPLRVDTLDKEIFRQIDRLQDER